ncbi:MAG: phage major capsid protein, partial [Pseudomonadota bacterium]|nr:phage major capsid protein [Pseudomonadota bacterium]
MNLHEKLQKKLARAKEIRESAEAAGREFTEAEETELETLAADCGKLKKQIDQAKQFDALEAETSTLQGRRTSPAPIGGNAKPKDETAEAMGGFKSEGEFFKAVQAAASGDVDNRLLAVAGNVVTNDGGTEGYSLPPAMRNQIFTVLEKDMGDMLSKVTSEVTGASAVSFLKDVTMPWQAAGIQVHWDQSGKKFEPTSINSVTAGELKLNGLSVLVNVDEDLLDDFPRLAQRMMVMAPEAMRWAINEAIRYGDGVGKPLGYMNSKALVTVAKETGQAAKTITADNVANMYTRMLASSLKKSHWEVNSELLPQLMKLKDEDDNLLWTPLNSGYKDEPNGLLLGRPVIFNEHPEAAGVKGDIQFVDPSGFYLALRTAAAKYAES